MSYRVDREKKLSDDDCWKLYCRRSLPRAIIIA